jgi:ribosomal protein S18 acetylase RimI-like enzyme
MNTNDLVVNRAQMADFHPWLDLAMEVEYLFGPMVSDQNFHRALRKNIQRGSAYCVRNGDGNPGNPLIGGLLISSKPPLFEIGWLAVIEEFRRKGMGELLVTHALEHVQTPAEVTVITFSKDCPEGIPARNFCLKMGFLPDGPAPVGPEGCMRQVFRLKIA